MIGQPPLGILHLAFWHRQHLESSFRVAMRHSHGHRYRQSDHTRAGNAHSHGVFKHILAQLQHDTFGFTIQ